jgi:hypothetical protein
LGERPGLPRPSRLPPVGRSAGGAGGAACRRRGRPGRGRAGTRAAEAAPDRQTVAFPTMRRQRPASRSGPPWRSCYKSARPFRC